MIIKQNDPNALKKLKENVGKEGVIFPVAIINSKWEIKGEIYQLDDKYYIADTLIAEDKFLLYDIEILN